MAATQKNKRTKRRALVLKKDPSESRSANGQTGLRTISQRLEDARYCLKTNQASKAIADLDEPRIEHQIAAMKDIPQKILVTFQLVRVLIDLRQYERAALLCEHLSEMAPCAAVFEVFSLVRERAGNYFEAIELLKKAIMSEPDQTPLWARLAHLLLQSGQREQVLPLLESAIEKAPENSGVFSRCLTAMHSIEPIDFEKIAYHTNEWVHIHAPSELAATQHDNGVDPDRKLRIGYVSPNFGEHPLIPFFEPLLAMHQREAFELFAYSNRDIPDAVTRRIRSKFDHFSDISDLTDQQAVQLIKEHQIDILVDLAGHTEQSRLTLFAYKPAPVQVSWSGYPNTTGLSQIDFRLTDPIADRFEEPRHYTEALFFMPHGTLCFDPGDLDLPVTALPAESNGFITFGSFNCSSTINDFMIKVWADILNRVSHSRLLLSFDSCADRPTQHLFHEKFAHCGIPEQQVRFISCADDSARAGLYSQVDIALDTYPYNGTATTCQALAMGVPVISLAGEHRLSRRGLSLLSRLGLEFFAGATAEEYTAKAVALAAKPDALAKIRSSMRARLAASELCNTRQFAQHIEQAYRTMWQ